MGLFGTVWGVFGVCLGCVSGVFRVCFGCVSGVFEVRLCTPNTPQTHPKHFLSFKKKLDAAQPQAELFGSVWGVLGVCLGSVWGVFGKCLGSVWEVFGNVSECLEVFGSTPYQPRSNGPFC